MSQPTTADRACPPQPRPTPAEVLDLERRFVAARRVIADAGDCMWSASSRSGAERQRLLDEAGRGLMRARQRLDDLAEQVRQAAGGKRP